MCDVKQLWRKSAKVLLLAAVLLSLVLPVYADAPKDGERLVDLNFDDGSTGDFMVYTNGGTSDLANENGQLVFHISNCGDLDYANQAYRDGFSLTEGCAYNFSFDITCDIERSLEYRIQLNGGDYHAYVSERVSVGPEKQHISAAFTMTEPTDPAPRIAFNAGIAPEMSGDPGEHSIFIDNLELTVTDASGAVSDETDDGAVRTAFVQAGLRPEDKKYAVVFDENPGGSFALIRENNGETVFEGELSEPVYDEAADSFVKTADFSSFTWSGRYYLHITCGEKETDTGVFRISRDEYDDIYKSVVQMLYMQRCGTALDENIAGEWTHGTCHDAPAVVYGTDVKKDVSGGWHDAGDYGRYVVPGAKTVADLFLAYELFGADGDEYGIPESGNGVPDLLDEAEYELLWMLKMQDEIGGVYHKVTCRNFPGAVMPEEEQDELVLSPVSYAATCDFAAVMAKAAGLYMEFDPSFADQAAKASEKAWEWILTQDHKEGFHNPEDISTGEYPDENLEDETLWAATELMLSDAVSTRTREKAAIVVDLQTESGLPGTGLGWDNITAYALTDLAQGAEDESLREKGKAGVLSSADSILEESADDAFGMALGTDYSWGSNMTVANNGMTLLLAELFTGDAKYHDAAAKQLDYLLGLNGTGYCFVTGFGSKSPTAPHHRPSQAVGEAVPGMLVGGPNSHLEDPYAQGALKEKAPALCYVDNDASYSTNEVAIYWNSPLIALMAGLEAEQESARE